MKIRSAWLVIDIVFTIFSIVIVALTAILVSPWIWILTIPITVFIPVVPLYSKRKKDQFKKRKYFELVYFSIVEVILTIITVFLPIPWNLVMIAIIIAIPVTIISVSFLDVISFNQSYQEYDSRATQEEFMKAQPYFCESCNSFHALFREICEHCGTRNSLRKATKKIYKKYIGQTK